MLDRSNTSILYDHLLQLPEGSEFDSKSLSTELGIPSPHISAALSNWRERGFVKIVRKEKRVEGRGGSQVFIYRLDDRTVELGIVATPRKQTDRASHSRGPNRRQVTVQTLAERLLQLAADLESLQPDIRQFSSSVLLAELARREKLTRHQSPDTSHQTPITSHQSPVIPTDWLIGN